MNKHITIGIDLDGVIADFNNKFIEFCNLYLGKSFPKITDFQQVKEWGHHKWLDITLEESDLIWEKIYSTENFWLTLDPLPIKNKQKFESLINQKTLMCILLHLE